MHKSFLFNSSKATLFKSILFINICFLGFILKAQQPLNLDFEKLSVDITSPWGWQYYQTGDRIIATLDSASKHSGKYSLLMKPFPNKNAASIQSFSSSLEPYQLRNRQVAVEGWVKCEDFFGKGFVIVNYRWSKTDTILNQSDTFWIDLQRNQNWMQFSALISMPLQLEAVDVSLCYLGSGSLWFDDLSIKINGKKVNELQVAKPFSKSEMQWLLKSSIKINTVDATTPSTEPVYDDLIAFKDIAGDASIIALGEATHGTSEFFRIKHRLLEYAVKEMGVRVFAIEDHQMEVEKVNDFVLYGKGNPEKSMAGMFYIWNSEEVINMIKWVRDYNIQHPDDKVEFHGFDMQSATLPLDSLFAFLQKNDKVLYDIANDLLAGLKKENQRMYMISDSTRQVWAVNAQKIRDMVYSKKAEWLSTAIGKKDSMHIEWAIQYANLIQQFAKESINPMNLYRDVAMADNISWILNIRKPGSKILIWAHDVHISKGEHPNVDYNYHAGISMGSWLAKKYGSKYKAFGISTYTGDYRAYPSYTNYSKFINCPAFPGPIGSLDEALHQISVKKKWPALLLDLSNARQLDWLSSPLPVRFANHVCFEYAYWTRFSIPYQFDGIFFIDKTTGAKK
jgi:erythromycin esterase